MKLKNGGTIKLVVLLGVFGNQQSIYEEKLDLSYTPALNRIFCLLNHSDCMMHNMTKGSASNLRERLGIEPSLDVSTQHTALKTAAPTRSASTPMNDVGLKKSYKNIYFAAGVSAPESAPFLSDGLVVVSGASEEISSPFSGWSSPSDA